MKVVKIIIQYILAIVFGISILALILINIASSTILSESYIMSKLDEESYYDKVYEEVKSNFEKYIYQSGLEETVLDDLVTKEKIKGDTQLILNSIYDGMNEEVSTDFISEKLNQNIENSLNGNISSQQRTAIDSFVKKICEEYESTILNTKYNSKINPIIKKVLKYLDTAKKALYITAGISLVIIAILTLKRIYKILARIGVALTVDGLILLIVKRYIFSKVNVYGITILGDGVSNVVRVVLTDIFGSIVKFGYLLLVSGIALIIVFGLIKSVRRMKRIKEQYTPEN